MDGLTILSEMATGSPRTRALATLNITPEQLASYAADMRSFLDHHRPEEEEEEGATAELSDNVAPTSTQQPPTEPTSPVDDPNFVSGLLTPPSGSPDHQEQRELMPDNETVSSKAEATSSRASSTRVERSSTTTSTTAPASEGDIFSAKPKPKIKIKLLPPKASGSSPSRTNTMASDNQKASAEPATKMSRRRTISSVRDIPTRSKAKADGARKANSSLIDHTPEADSSRVAMSSPAQKPGATFQYPFTSLHTPRRALPKVPIPVTSPAPFEEEELPFKLPPGPRSKEKPQWSYAALIGQAILASPQQKLSLNQIYSFISMAYPYYEKDQAGWRNSIRHNLSLNGSFIKVPREAGARGKGSLWAINPSDLECFKGGGYIRKGSTSTRKRKNDSDDDDEDFLAPNTGADPPSSSQGGSKRRKNNGHTYPPFFQHFSQGAAYANGPYGTMPIVYYPLHPMYAVGGANGMPQYYAAAIPVPAGGTMHPLPMPNAATLQSNPYLAFSQSFAAARKSNQSSGAITTPRSSRFSASTASHSTTSYSTPTRHTTASCSGDSPIPTSSPLPPSSPLSPVARPMSSPLPPSSPLPSSSPLGSPPAYLREVDDLESEDEVVIKRPNTERTQARGQRHERRQPEDPTSEEHGVEQTEPNKQPPEPSAKEVLDLFGSFNRRYASSSSSPSRSSHSRQQPARHKQWDLRVTPKGRLASSPLIGRGSGNARPFGSLSNVKVPTRMPSLTAAAARADGSPPPRGPTRASLGSAHNMLHVSSKDVRVKASSSSSMISTPPDGQEGDSTVQVHEDDVVNDDDSIFGVNIDDDTEEENLSSDNEAIGAPIIKRLELRPPISETSPKFLNAENHECHNRTPSPSPVAEPRTPEPMDGSAASAQDLINRVLGAAGSKRPPQPSTPNNWRANAATDLSFNLHKAPSPLTPFAHSTSPIQKHVARNSARSQYPPRTPFRTPPPKLRADRQRQVLDGARPEAELADGDSLASGSEPSSSTHRTPRLLGSHVLNSGGPDYGLRDMFGLSPLRTPLAHRSGAVVGSTDLASFKRSLLPPSPFRTPTSSSRYTRPGDEDDDGIDHEDNVDVDAAFDSGFMDAADSGHFDDRTRIRRPSVGATQGARAYDTSAHAAADDLARLQEAPVTPLGSSTLFRRFQSSQSPTMSPGNWRMF